MDDARTGVTAMGWGVPAAPEPARPPSLLETFRERRISLRSMDRTLRFATAGAFAILLGSAILIALRDVPQHQVYLGGGDHGVHQVGAVFFVVSLLLLSLGFGYLATAALCARPIVGIPAFALLLFALGFYTGAFGSTSGSVTLGDVLPAWARWTSRALLVGLVAVAVGSALAQRGRPARHGRTPAHAVTLVVNVALFTSYWAVLAVASPKVGELSVFGPVVNVLLGSVSLALTPFLQIAAVDFGEWGQALVERIGGAVARSVQATAWLAAAACAALGGWGFAHTRHGVLSGANLWSSARGVLVVGVFWLVLCGLGRALRVSRESMPRSLGFAPVAAACAALSIGILPLAGLVNGNFAVRAPAVVEDGRFAAGADVVAYRADGHASEFSLLLPRAWQAQQGQGVFVASFGGGTDPAETVVATNAPGPATLAALASGLRVQLHGARAVGRWTVGEVTAGGGRAGLLWLRTAREPLAGRPTTTSYLVEELTDAPIGDDTRATFEAIGNSVHLADEEPAEPPAPAEEADPLAHEERLFAWQAGLGLACVAVLIGGLALWRGRRAPRVVGAVLVLAGLVVMGVEVDLQPLGRWAFGPDSRIPTVGQGAVYVGIGFWGIVALVVAARRAWRRRDGSPTRLPAALVGLIGAVAALTVMDALYTRALQASTVAVWAAIILLVAVSWEVVMSGESLTNLDTARLPRPARLFGFLGYTIVVTAAVLFFSAQTVIGSDGATEPFFEPESVTQAALFAVALPLFAVVFYLRVTASAAAADAPAVRDDGHPGQEQHRDARDDRGVGQPLGQ